MLTTAKPTDLKSSLPFDADRLDRLMDEAGLDVLLATSKHNVQYLLGGHRAFFFDYMDAMGLSRYLPVVIYPKGAPDKAAYIGARLETFQTAVRPLWVPDVQTTSNGSVDTMEKAVDTIRGCSASPIVVSARSSASCRSTRARCSSAPSRMTSLRIVAGARAPARAQERGRAGDAQVASER